MEREPFRRAAHATAAVQIGGEVLHMIRPVFPVVALQPFESGITEHTRITDERGALSQMARQHILIEEDPFFLLRIGELECTIGCI